METFSALLAICAGNSPVPGEFHTQRPVMRSFDVFFDPRLNNRLSKQSWGWWLETLSCPLWRHCNDVLPLFRVRSWKNGLRCISFYILIKLPIWQPSPPPVMTIQSVWQSFVLNVFIRWTMNLLAVAIVPIGCLNADGWIQAELHIGLATGRMRSCLDGDECRYRRTSLIAFNFCTRIMFSSHVGPVHRI